MKFSIHPLFFVFGLYFALTGKVFLFLTATLTALLHEFGHALAAEKLGGRAFFAGSVKLLNLRLEKLTGKL